MERRWFKIGEAARRVGVKPKELRYWEKVIPEILPRRSKGNLRYYHVDELPRLKQIKTWLSEGLTVADCRELLKPSSTHTAEMTSPSSLVEKARASNADQRIQAVLTTLKDIVSRLSKPPASG